MLPMSDPSYPFSFTTATPHTQLLPNDIRRDFELMREMDRDALQLEKELALLEAAYLDRARIRKAENKPISMPRIEPLLDVHASHLSQPSARRGSLDIVGGAIPGALNLSSPVVEAHPTPDKEESRAGSHAKNQKEAPSAATDKQDRHPKGHATGTGTGSGAAHGTPADTNDSSSKDVGKEKDKDAEGVRLLAHIAALRSRIRSRLNQKTSNAINLSTVLAKFQAKLNSDLAFFETSLRSCGDFALASGARPGADVAMRPSQSSDEMILGKVIVYYADVGAYDVADVDNSKRYHLSEALVTVLDMVDITSKRLSKGEVIYAVYPETTAFYLASVSQAPRRAPPGVEPTVLVQFQGDSDDQGVTPVVVVLLRHCFRAFA